MSLRSVRRTIRAWGRQQLYSFFSSLGTLVSHRLASLVTALVLGIAMMLPLGLFVTVANLHAVDLQQEDWGTLTVFLEPGVGDEQALELARRIEQEQGAVVIAVSPDQGLQEFQQASGFGQALELFEENPLPWVLQVRQPGDDATSLEDRISALSAWIGERQGVAAIEVDFKWLQRLSSLLALGDAFVKLLSVLFSLAVIVVVANTIRLDVANRASEIEVLHLVGASGGFIRQPFMYLGFWYGLLGAMLALVLMSLCLAYLEYPLARLTDAYGNAFELRGLDLRGGLLVLAAGSLLGLLGAWMSVQRYLRQFRLEESRVRG